MNLRAEYSSFSLNIADSNRCCNRFLRNIHAVYEQRKQKQMIIHSSDTMKKTANDLESNWFQQHTLTFNILAEQDNVSHMYRLQFSN